MAREDFTYWFVGGVSTFNQNIEFVANHFAHAMLRHESEMGFFPIASGVSRAVFNEKATRIGG